MSKKEIGVVGLGKMGGNIVRRLMDKGWSVHGHDFSKEITDSLGTEGMIAAYSLQELVEQLSPPRVMWLMVPARGKTENDPRPVDEVLFSEKGIAKLLGKGDVVIDGGNSFYREDERRAQKLAESGVGYIDVGFSGGPSGARSGGCLMIGGDQASFTAREELFRDLSRENAYQFFAGSGAGHFVKMVHNGIEYGMMQSIGEGFEILKKSSFGLDLSRVADIYNHGSVIESRLVGWAKSAFEQYGQDLEEVSGSVGHTGEGEWTAKTAKEFNVEAPIIEGSFNFRVESEKKPSFTGKVVSALRNQFGGHSIKK